VPLRTHGTISQSCIFYIRFRPRLSSAVAGVRKHPRADASSVQLVRVSSATGLHLMVVGSGLQDKHGYPALVTRCTIFFSSGYNEYSKQRVLVQRCCNTINQNHIQTSQISGLPPQRSASFSTLVIRTYLPSISNIVEKPLHLCRIQASLLVHLNSLS
jgi:hypothetical protein